MAIPDYQTFMLPLLKFISDNKEHSLRETIEHLSETFNLTEYERKELLPSGTQPIINNRISWARTYMRKAGLIESTRRGYFKITKRGLGVLNKKPNEINVKFLEQFPEFIEFRTLRRDKETEHFIVEPTLETPEESMDLVYHNIKQSLASEILEAVKKSSPSFFERIVVDLLVQMGYGGSRKDAGEAVGRTGDEGIDGIIKEDRLGLDIIYIQAKRWEGIVGRPEIQKFVGALQGKRAKRGIFLTTSSFTKEAIDYTSSIDIKVILIDGD
jgi:restriction system protein